MKKFLSSILLLSLLVLSACQDDIKTEINNKADGYPVFHVSIADEGVRTGFNDALQMEWAAGDRIAIKCGDATAIYAAKAAGASADFEYVSGDTLPAEGSFEAYYPASLAGEAVLPAEQTYIENNIAASPMRATSSDTNLTFKHLCGILELNLTTSDSGIKVGGISLESAEGMSGGFTLEGDAARIGSGAGNVNMEIADSLALGSTAAKIYLAVPEGTYATGTKFIVKTNKGWRVFSSNKALTFTRACITPAKLTVAASEISKFRTSTDAGKTWTYNTDITAATSAVPDAGTKSDCIIEMLSDFSQTAQWAIVNKKFTFDGLGHTITVPSLTDTTSIYPQSASNVTFKDVTIQGPGTSSTYNNRAMVFESGNYVILDGCVIKDFKNSTNGAALRGDGTLVMTGKSRIENCHSTASGCSGGAIMCENGTVTIGEGVTISGCSATEYGGALAMRGSSKLAMGRAIVTDCQTTAGPAGAIWLTGLSYSTITGATFTNCKATGGNGGCLLINNSDATATMTNCTISGCSCSSSTTYGYGGAIRATAGTLTFTGGTIKDCVAKYGGGVSTSGGTVNLSGVSISGCAINNSGSGGTFHLTGGTINVTDNSVITGTNAYMTTAGTLNIDSSTYDYTGTGTALYVVGTSETANKGVINISNHSLIKSKGYDINATWGKVTCTDSDFISSGTACVFVKVGGQLTFTNSRGVNTSARDTATVFYSDTYKSSASLSVRSGYYSGNYIARRGVKDTYMCRIYIYSGCYSRTNKVSTKVGWKGTTTNLSGHFDTLDTPVSEYIDGNNYTFNYIVQ